MRQRTRIGIISAFLALAFVVGVVAQRRPDFVGEVGGEQQAPRLAVPDMLAAAGAGGQIGVFNDTLWNDLDSAGQFEMVSKSFYPRATPSRPEDVRVGDAGLPADPSARGMWLAGWAQPPVTSRYMTFGHIEVIGDRLVLNGYLYDTTAANMASAHIFGKRYYAAISEAGARQLAHDFSRDVLENLGLGSGLAGSRVYFVSDRTGNDEIWAMDYDGSNQTQLTNYKNLCMTPAVDKDATRLAFTTFVTGTPSIFIHSLETNRRLTFYNQEASLNTTPWFLPDGSGILYASSISGRSQLYRADVDGRNLQRISYSHAIDIHPIVNPKTGAQIAFTSGRSGIPQIYLMDMDGANVRKLSPGGGDAVQPSWDPQGENVAFAWTRGFEPGNYNIFIINAATEQLVQLTYGVGRNEHPSWSPSGTHLVFSSNRSGGTQIWTMRADGTQPVRLTSQGRNHMPMWGAK